MPSPSRPHESPFAIAMALASALSLGGCEDTWFGGDEEDPLPGKRISVLVHSRDLEPDPAAATKEILLPAPTINDAWPQAGGYPNHAMHHIKVGAALERAWKTDIGAGSDDENRIVSSPVVADGKVFVVDSESTVSAYDAKDGDELWRKDLTARSEDDGHISGGLAWNNGTVYVSTGFGGIAALDAKTGKPRWTRVLDGPIRSAPSVRGGRIFVITVENKLHALSAKNGRTLWTHGGITEIASLLGGASPAVDQGVVVAPYSSGEIVALSVENGRVIWTDSLGSVKRTDVVSTLSHIRGRPIIDRGLVFALSHGGFTVAIDLRSGRRVWEREVGGPESPWIAGDYLFLLTNNQELVCLSRRSGAIHWVTPLPRWEDEEEQEGPILWTGPMLASDRLIIANSEGTAMAISPYTGRILGEVDMPDGVTVPPVAAKGRLYFLTDDADLVAYK